eukprot:5233234-Pyramimonas_sp.AAC.1
MRPAAAHLDRPAHMVAGALTTEDRLGTTMRFLRASERQSQGTISACISCYPAPGAAQTCPSARARPGA